MPRPAPPRRRAAAPSVAGLALALALTGCGGSASTATPSSREPAALTSAPPTGTSTPPPPAGASTLPPGDPGVAPSVPEDTSGIDDAPGPGPRTDVPQAALLDAETVTSVVGGSWSSVTVPGDSCAAPRPAGWVASRSAGLAGSRGQLVETVSTHRDDDAARTVQALAKRLRECGWTQGDEPPLGEDSALVTRTTSAGLARLVVVAADGLTVTVRGSGPVAGSADDWAAVIDVAIGTSCLAAADGCH